MSKNTNRGDSLYGSTFDDHIFLNLMKIQKFTMNNDHNFKYNIQFHNVRCVVLTLFNGLVILIA